MYYVSASGIWPDKRMAFGGSDLIGGVTFGGSDLIRGWPI